MRNDRFDVLERLAPLFEAPEPSFERFLRRRDRKRRNQRITAGVVGIAVFAAAVALFAGQILFDRTLTPANPGPTVRTPAPTLGLGLPPEGAVPSAPETGELIASLHARPGTGTKVQAGMVVHQVWVYADGRVIRRREGANGMFLERRLTPEGIELLLSELLSTGLFDRDGYFLSGLGLSWGDIEVRSGDRLVSVVWCCLNWGGPNPIRDLAADPTPQQARALIRLSEGLADPVSWLPASAWENPDSIAYVPSKYAICYEQQLPGPPYEQSLAPSRVLSVLPTAAQDLLRGKDKTYVVLDSPLSDRSERSAGHASCSEVTIADARALDRIFSDARFDPNIAHWDWVLTYRAEAPDPIGTFLITFEPILPHGQWEDMAG